MRMWKKEENEDACELSRNGIEVWSPYPDTNYLVSNLGRVFNKSTGKYLEQSVSPMGYKTAGPHQVHRMVMKSFGYDLFIGSIVHHKDNNRDHNSLYNLAVESRTDHASHHMSEGEMRHRSGVTAPLPSNYADIVIRYEKSEISGEEASQALGRSGVWLWGEVYRRRWAGKPESSPLTLAEKQQALSDAKEGKETFWLSWPGHPGYEVSNLGNVRSTETKIVKNKQDGYTKPLGAKGQLHIVVLTLYGPPKPEGEQTIACHYPDPTTSNCSIANLIWGTYKDNAAHSKEQGLLPSGEDHHRTKLTNAQVEEGLKLFVENHWTVKELNAFWGEDSNEAYNIITGSSWVNIKRPEGLDKERERITREGEGHHLNNGLTASSIERGLILYTRNHWSAQQFSDHLGIPLSTGAQILSGTWAEVKRPVGFRYPWPDSAVLNRLEGSNHPRAITTEARIKAMFHAFLKDELKTLDEIAAYLGLSTITAREIMDGDKWMHVQRPPGLNEKWKETIRFRFKSDQREKIKILMQAGKTDEEIAVAVGSPSALQIKPYRTEFKKQNGEKFRWSKEEKTILAELVKSGMTASEINNSGKLPGRKVDGTAVMRAKRAIKAAGL